MTKQKRIWLYLLDGNTLTQEQARSMFNHWRLASAVDRLREKIGKHGVATHLIGETKYAQYHVPKSVRDRYKPLLSELRKQSSIVR
jgi:hypothetical protein